jgi:hypothetical protein
MADAIIPELYTEAEAAKRLRCDRGTVSRERYRGNIGFTKIAGKVMLTAEHIRDYIESRSVKPCRDQDEKSDSGSTKAPVNNTGQSAGTTRPPSGQDGKALVSASIHKLRSGSPNTSSNTTSPRTPHPSQSA